tara:strand:- start:1853 stop:2893 length:1041 start_codon:yes stop_codon:yes gene_type:complete
MNRKFKSLISERARPYIIAEVSANHCGSIVKAKNIITAAKKSGASAVKIQTYEAENMTIDCDKPDFKIKHGLWAGHKLFDLYKSAQTPFLWHERLFSHAKKEGITIFSTPFDDEGVDLLEKLDVPFFKVASFEITDTSLLEYIASKKKPILLSTGISSKKEIGDALEIIRSKGVNDILLFHCISSYPAKAEDYNLNMIKTLKKTFNTLVGLSDHTLGLEASIASIPLGAVAIEKHFKLDKNDQTPDSEFSIDPEQLKELVTRVNAIWKGLGSGKFYRTKEEKKNIVFRRSLYFIKDLKKGHIITKNDVKCVRPGYALAPKEIKNILFKKTKVKVRKGDRVTLKKIE